MERIRETDETRQTDRHKHRNRQWVRQRQRDRKRKRPKESFITLIKATETEGERDQKRVSLHLSRQSSEDVTEVGRAPPPTSFHDMNKTVWAIPSTAGNVTSKFLTPTPSD